MDSDNKAVERLIEELNNVTLNEVDEKPEVSEAVSLAAVVDNMSLPEGHETIDIISREVILPKAEDKNTEARAAYLNKILNPSDPIEQKRLDQKLALTFTEKQNGVTLQEKLDSLVEALTNDFDEMMDLQSQTDFALNEYAEANFKPYVAVKGFLGNYLETEEAMAAREIKENEARRKQFIVQNREKCLLDTLRAEIRSPQNGLSTTDIEVLNKEEKAQKLIETPRYKNLVGVHFDKKTKLTQQDFKKHSDLLGIAMQAKSNAKLDASELFTEEAMMQKPIARTVMFNQFKSSLASAKNQVQDEIDVKAGRKNGFKALV